jgi:RimJ/RimL family protein N-acetyltransferase
MSSDVRLREVRPEDLPILFEHQRDPEAARVAAFPSRDREAFLAHWTRILADPGVTARTILCQGAVAGNILSFQKSGRTLVGYWIGRQLWGKGVATRALSLFLLQVSTRPLFAHVARGNLASIRVLEKCGFKIHAEDRASADALIDGVEEIVLMLSGPGL